MLSLVALIAVSSAGNDAFYPLACAPPKELETGSVNVSAEVGLIGGDSAIMFTMRTSDASSSWQGIGFPSVDGVEYYITRHIGDSVVTVLDFWTAPGNESVPSLRDISTVTVVFNSADDTRFFRRAVVSSVNATSITVGQPFDLVTVEGSGIPGEPNWWSTRHSVVSQVDLMDCKQDSSPLDTTGSPPQMMYAEEGNFSVQMLPGIFHDSYEVGVELRLTVNVSFFNEYGAGWAGVAFPGGMVDADMYITNGADYLGNLFSANVSGPSENEDSSLRYTALDYASGVFVARFVRPLQYNSSETVTFAFDREIPFGVAFGPGNPDPSVDTLAQDIYAVGNLTFVLRDMIPSAPVASPSNEFSSVDCKSEYANQLSVTDKNDVVNVAWELGVADSTQPAVRFTVILPASWSNGSQYFGMGFTNKTVNTTKSADMFVVMASPAGEWTVKDMWSTGPISPFDDESFLGGENNYTITDISISQEIVKVGFWRCATTDDSYDTSLDQATHVMWAIGTVVNGEMRMHYESGVAGADFKCPPMPDEGSDTSVAVATVICIAFFIALGTGLFVYSRRSSLPGAVSLLEEAE
ncbi:hypothetical protein DIPPA_57825 [Diplonema papillatum]|nr:hypothetical protein DIPPA_57825 [Diplonema papillatum]